MGKLQHRTWAKERRTPINSIKRNKNRAGIVESSVKICGECGEEFCSGESCGDILYDSFIRVTIVPNQMKIKISPDSVGIISNINKPRRKKDKKRRSVKTSQTTGARLLVRKRKKSKRAAAKKDKSKSSGSNQDTEKKFKRKCSKRVKKRGSSTKST